MNRVLAALTLLVVMPGCGGSDRSSPVAPTVPAATITLTRLRIGGNAALTTVGETSQLTTIATFSDGTERDVTAEAAWTSSEPSVVTVVSGLVTVRRLGATTISARYLNMSATVSVRPTPPGTFVVYGRAREPGRGGLIDVTVTDTASLISTKTDINGTYFLAGLPRGESRLRFTKNDFESAEDNATQAFGDTELQRTIRVRVGETVRPPDFAPNDFTYMVGGERCFPCRLVRVVAEAPATVHFRITWGDVRATLTLLANGSVMAGSTSELEADVPLPRGESIVYVGMKTNVGIHMPFTIETR